MRSTRGCALALLAAAALACARPPAKQVEACTAGEAPRPAVDSACVHGLEGQRFVGALGGAVGASLTGRHSHPGTARLRVDFDDGGVVERTCFGSVSGSAVARRLPDAVRAARALPPAPACFAGRRLEFAWESPVVTTEHVQVATRECQERVDPHRTRIGMCRQRQDCSVEKVNAMWEAADDALRSCVLERVPLPIHSADARESHHFVPIEGVPPSPALAVRAGELCEGLPDHPAVVECMRLLGWRPLE
jgi:hypothetical protein